MNSVSSPLAMMPSAKAEGDRRSREFSAITGTICATFVLGAFGQFWIAPGPRPLVIGATASALAVLLAGWRSRSLRDATTGFRFAAAMLLTLGAVAVLGTLILQGKNEVLYRERFGALADVILLFRLDDIFHSLWFGALSGLLLGSVIASAARRWPLSVRNAGFFACHAGLALSMMGAALSTTFALKGRVNLHAGGAAVTTVTVGDPEHGEKQMPLGFAMRLNKFDLERYAAEHRIGVYEADSQGRYDLKASFDPDPGVRHRLPDGAWFRVKSYHEDARNPSIEVELYDANGLREGVLVASKPGGMAFGTGYGLTFESRADEAKTFRSAITVVENGRTETATVAVNSPVTFGEWTFYQANFDPKDPTFSGLEVVHDPGVAWVFGGFGLIAVGVVYMIYIEPRLRRYAQRTRPRVQATMEVAA